MSIRVGVSSCLLGRKVRYDGDDRRDDVVCDVLAPHVEWVPVCPEVELGLGVPRPTIRLERHGRALRLVEPSSGRDLTAAMRAYAAARVEALGGLCGYVFKASSPSCGVEGVLVEGEGRRGTGMFAATLMARYPRLPVEDEVRLRDPRRRESFAARVFALHRLRAPGFVHAREELLLLAHAPGAPEALSRLRGEAYVEAFVELLRRPPTRAGHARALREGARDLGGALDAEIEAYRRGEVPLSVPLERLRRLARGSVREQSYLLRPHPAELA